MLIYLVLAIFPLFLGNVFPNLMENKRQRKQFYFLCGMGMLAVMGLRHYSLGSLDTLHYYNDMIRAIASSSWQDYFKPDYYEIGSQFFIFSLSRVFRDPQWLLIVTSAFYIVSILYFVDHNCEDIPLSITAYIVLGLMTFHLQGMRQSIAMCICLFAYEQAKERHIVKFSLLVMLATAFHQTAIVFFILYYIVKIRHSFKSMLFSGVGCAVVMFSADRLLRFANTVFDRNYGNAVESGGLVATAIYFIILAVSLLYYRIYEQDQRTPLIYVLILGTVCYIMRYMGARAAERISFYFAFSQIALLPLATRITVERDRQIMHIIVTILMVALYAYRLNGSEFIPYRFFWQ